MIQWGLWRSLVQRLSRSSVLSACFTYYLSMLTIGCAPYIWLDEAKHLRDVGDVQSALSRYEDVLIAQSSQLAYPLASELLDEQITSHHNALKRAFEEQDADEACLAAWMIEDLGPFTPEASLFDKEVKAAIESVLDALPGLDYLGRSHRLHWSEQLIGCPLEHSAELVFEQRLKLLKLIQETFSKTLLTQGNVYEWPFIDHFVQQLDQGSFASPVLLGLIQQALQDHWRAYWIDTAMSAGSDGRWGEVWVYSSLSQHRPRDIFLDGLEDFTGPDPRDDACVYGPDGHCLPPPLMMRSDDFYFNHLLHLAQAELERRGAEFYHVGIRVSVDEESAIVAPYLLKNTPTLLNQQSRRLPQWLSPELVENWSIHERDVVCSVETRSGSKELRYLDRSEQVISPRYQAALKRVEQQQAVLEAAQSEQEQLTQALDNAHSTLDRLDVDTIYNAQIKRDQIQQQVSRRKEKAIHLTQHEEAVSGERLVGPADPEIEHHLEELKVAQEIVLTELQALSIQLEIAQGELDEYLQKKATHEAEVKRLAQSLENTEQEITSATRLLEEREATLKQTERYEALEVFSVFRYPVTENHLECELIWELMREPSAQSDLVGPPVSTPDEAKLPVDPILLTFSSSDSQMTHRAYPRYKIQGVSVDSDVQKMNLLKTMRENLAQSLARWGAGRKDEWVIHRGKALVRRLATTSKPSVKVLNRLAMLTYLHPEHFRESLSENILSHLKLPRSMITLTSLLVWPITH